VLRCQGVQPRAGVIAAAIVDGDHLIVGGVALRQRRGKRVVQVLRFVVAGHQQGGEGGQPSTHDARAAMSAGNFPYPEK